MKRMVLAAAVLAQTACAQTMTFTLRDVVELEGAEVVSFYEPDQRFLCAYKEGIAFLAWREDTWEREIVVASQRISYTHVSAQAGENPLIIAAGHNPDKADSGSIVSLDPGTGVSFWIELKGEAFDCVAFAPGGRDILLAAENEASSAMSDRPGALCIVPNVQQHAEMNNGTRCISVSNDPLVSYPIDRALIEREPAIRIHPARRSNPEIDIEPEYITTHDNTAYVTLQENNAIGVFDLVACRWTEIIPIPVITQTIDASDKDGIAIDDEVRCMPMPDQIVYADGALFFPGEGDTRSEFGEGGLEDHARLGDLVERGLAAPHPGLERLKVCTFTGDTNGDGVINEPHAFGSRALHKYDLETREWSHTGSLIERTIAGRYPDHFDDNRSDDRGPEPEGITVGEVGGKTVLFISIERPGAVMAFDTDLNFLGMVMSAADGHTAPEGMCFVPAEESPLCVDTLAVAFERSGHLVFYEVTLDAARAVDE